MDQYASSIWIGYGYIVTTEARVARTKPRLRSREGIRRQILRSRFPMPGQVVS